MKKFSILITTYNRLNEIKITLDKICHLIERKDVECIICDDASTDGTYNYIEKNYKNVKLIKNSTNKGLIYSRNQLLAITNAKYAISLDDDANFVTINTLEIIENYFYTNKAVGVISFRVFWGTLLPKNTVSIETSKRVKGFVGCGHVWRMEAWKSIPSYPYWFQFYGEEDFAAFHLFRKGWHIHYVPEILVQHRVNLKKRRKAKDYLWRLRRSLRSGWYLYFLFYPVKLIPKKMTYTLWMQLKLKVFKGEFKVVVPLLLAIFDVCINFPRLVKNAYRLSDEEYLKYQQLPNTVYYWKPEIMDN